MREIAKELVTFLQDYSWIYNFSNIRILLDKDDHPFIHHFSQEALIKFHEKRNVIFADILSKLKCGKSILDIGSGLGYVDHILETVYGYKTLGIEKSRFGKSPTNRSVVAIDLKDNEEGFLNKLIDDRLDGSACMIGLHACGDLTPTMLKAFVYGDRFTSLAVVSCCYHKMSMPFTPMSKFFREEIDFSSIFTPYGLRLASQEVASDDKSQLLDERHRFFTYRSVLEVLSGEMSINKSKRKAVRKNGIKTFEDYIQNVFDRFDFDPKFEQGYISNRLREIFKEHEPNFSLLKYVIILQDYVQKLIEYSVLLDRVIYLQENDYDKVIVYEIFNEKISPRNKLIFCPA
ncbi:unnamed protein product [Lepeophtheirus salmonis]|uniref:(salmon louse) hypothetical protein n=1 Tax=Lepeophtheirus salmonis TaxID=72036 RepID=A0A7R8CZI8_LEPSM|nr:unnamed protein product [Lepeophtheirus salmonis]CAF2950775.1 unnamed protein product [Lepeophtheirus salmonis]